MPKAQRDKGKRWERDVASMFRAIFGDRVVRGWQSWKGSAAPDVDGTPFWIEAKHHKLVNIPAAYDQACRDMLASGRKGMVPIAITKSDRSVPLATLSLNDFLDLVKEWTERGSIIA